MSKTAALAETISVHSVRYFECEIRILYSVVNLNDEIGSMILWQFIPLCPTRKVFLNWIFIVSRWSRNTWSCRVIQLSLYVAFSNDCTSSSELMLFKFTEKWLDKTSRLAGCYIVNNLSSVDALTFLIEAKQTKTVYVERLYWVRNWTKVSGEDGTFLVYIVPI